MHILITNTTKLVVIVEIFGDVDLESAGQLFDVLMESADKRQTKLIVDLSGVNRMTRAGVRGIVVAAKLLQSAEGRMRICGANPTVLISTQK